MDHTTPPPGGIPRHAALDPADCRNPGLLHTPCAASGGRWQDAPPDTTGNAAPLAPAGHRRLGRWRLSRQPNPAACAPVIHHRPERLSRGHDSPRGGELESPFTNEQRRTGGNRSVSQVRSMSRVAADAFTGEAAPLFSGFHHDNNAPRCGQFVEADRIAGAVRVSSRCRERGPPCPLLNWFCRSSRMPSRRGRAGWLAAPRMRTGIRVCRSRKGITGRYCYVASRGAKTLRSARLSA